MPAALDKCVASLRAKWRKSPKDAPKRHKVDGKWKSVKGEDDLKSAAFAICQASTGLQEECMISIADKERELLEAMLDEDGQGPLLRGVGAVNRPYLKFMRPLEIINRDGREMIRAQIVRFGIYRHPLGPDGKLPFTKDFWP